MQISFIGLGAMGMPMARNLIKKNFSVRGFDARPDAVDTLAEAGGQPSQSVADALDGADIAILMVVNAAQAEDILFLKNGLNTMAADGTVVLMATCPPGTVVKIAERVQQSGRNFLDAPVSGGMAGAIAGTLTIMAAGKRQIFDRLHPVFSALGDKIFHVGEQPGQGATVKTVNQLLCGVHIAVVAEAFAFAEKLGIDMRVLLQILSGSSASSWMLKDRGPRMLEEKPAVTSAVDIFVKDLGIVLEAGRESKTAMPLSAIAHQMFLAASGRGEGLADDSQVIESYRKLNQQPA